MEDSLVEKTVTPQHDDDDDMMPPDDDNLLPMDDSSSVVMDQTASLEVSRDEQQHKIGGLEDDDDSSMERQQMTKKKTRRPKKRKIVINDETELSKTHMRDMLSDTSNIILAGRSRKRPRRLGMVDWETPMPGLHPEIAQLWARNTSLVRGQPLDYPMKKKEQQQSPLNDDNDEVASTEQVRREETLHDYDDNVPMPTQDDDDVPLPDDDYDVPLPEEDDLVAPPSPPGSVVDDYEPMISFEHSNAAVEMNDEDDESSSWHKHTQTVYDTLQAQKIDEEPLEFQEMCHGVNRRTAAGVFLELLQLKTWDYIDLEQGRAYGNIVISQGAKWGTK